MTGQIAIQSYPESTNRRQPLLPPRRSVFSPARYKKANVGECAGSAVALLPPKRSSVLSPARAKKANVGECAGSAVAECASIFCCCPFVVAEFLVIAVYKLPTAICRRIWKKLLLRKKLKKKKMSSHHAVRDSGRMSTIHCFDDESSEPDLTYFEAVKVSIDGSAEVVDLDREMWERCHNSGFGRSLSQRHVSGPNFEDQ